MSSITQHGDHNSDTVWDPGLFRAAGHVSLWATDQAEVTDFFFTLTGFGLCVERLSFDEALRASAVVAGTCIIKGVRFESCTGITSPSFNWQLTLSSHTGSRHYHARYLIDCSGRRAAVARALGIQTVDNNDQLFAYAQWYSAVETDDDRYTRIEAAPHGWWYSNRLPGTEGVASRRLVVFHSDKDLPAAKMAARPEGFNQVLDDSTHISSLLKDKGYVPSGAIRGAPANSQRLQDFCGDAWMAVYYGIQPRWTEQLFCQRRRSLNL